MHKIDYLNLKKKHRRKKEAREHKKFTVGGEVTRVFGLDYDLALVVGFLEHFNKLSDEQKQALKNNGERLLKSRMENADK